jgi:succinate dehydrogenase / fumarate reductase flavoprotein subunit
VTRCRTDEGEALRDDENFTNVTVWEYKGEDSDPVAHTEDLIFETVQPTQRSYK